jgi:formylglycine-generating enzyme required for sulfatase activity
MIGRWRTWIVGPAEAPGLKIDEALVHQMVKAASGKKGGLALLAFVLRELYKRIGSSDPWTLQDYHAIGGLEGAIGRSAEQVLAEFEDAERLLPRVFSHLLHMGDEMAEADETPLTRRRAPLGQWPTGTPERALIDNLVQARLLTTDKRSDEVPTLEVAHEALLREWPRIRDWAEDRRYALRIRDEVMAAAKQWQGAKYDHQDTYRWRDERAAPARQALEAADLLDHLPLAKAFLELEMDRLLAELDDPTTDHLRREAIGLRMAELEAHNPRPGVGVRPDGVPDILWCDLEASRVEIEGHGPFDVKPFRMAAYPVTWAQYRAFLEAPDADGYGNKRWWRGLTQESEPGRLLWAYPNYPAINVSWFDAVAFCRWLSKRRGEAIHLPDEWEWQLAAQSADPGFAYPWGEAWRENVANTHESDIGRTIAVGVYPSGRSRQAIYDLAGNVWEWCHNAYNNPKAKRPGRDESRVLRGGSWYDDREGARAGYRFVSLPLNRNLGIGFRVVCSSPIRSEH